MIRDVLEFNRMSQRDLSGASGVHETRISQYLNGRRDMSAANVEKMLCALGIRLVVPVKNQKSDLVQK